MRLVEYKKSERFFLVCQVSLHNLMCVSLFFCKICLIIWALEESNFSIQFENNLCCYDGLRLKKIETIHGTSRRNSYWWQKKIRYNSTVEHPNSLYEQIQSCLDISIETMASTDFLREDKTTLG